MRRRSSLPRRPGKVRCLVWTSDDALLLSSDIDGPNITCASACSPSSCSSQAHAFVHHVPGTPAAAVFTGNTSLQEYALGIMQRACHQPDCSPSSTSRSFEAVPANTEVPSCKHHACLCRVWDVRMAAPVRTLATAGVVTSIELSKDGRHLTTADGKEVKVPCGALISRGMAHAPRCTRHRGAVHVAWLSQPCSITANSTTTFQPSSLPTYVQSMSA